jgi:large subunit ribosomal protein L15
LFEGGSTPLFLRLPKFGFNNANFARRFHIVNIGDLESTFDEGATVTTQGLISARLIPDNKLPVKVLGKGTLTRKFAVEAQKFSESAAKRIEAVGGQASIVPRK